MDFQWLLFAFLLISVIIGAVKTVWNPIMKNVIRLACIPVAFLITLIIHIFGGFKAASAPLAGLIVNNLEVLTNMPDTKALMTAGISSVLASVFFVIAFALILLVLRLAAVNPISKLIKTSGENKENVGFKALSVLSGALGGFLVLGVMLMPVFSVMDLGVTAVSGSREHPSEKSSIYRVLNVLDERVIEPYESSVTAKIYKALGISDAMTAIASMPANFETESGDRSNAITAVKTLLSNGLDAVVLIESEGTDSDALSKDLDAVFHDPALLAMLSELLVENADALFDGGETEEDSLTAVISDSLREHYKNIDKTMAKNDITVIADAMIYLCDEHILSEISMPENGMKGFGVLLDNEEALEELVSIFTHISSYDLLLRHIYDYEISSLVEILDIPHDDAEAYDLLIDHLLVAVNKVENDSYSMENVKAFAEKFAESGLPIIGIDFSDKSEGSDATLYEDWKAYKDAWSALQDAFSAACEDTSMGNIWVLTDNGMYFYDPENYTFEKKDELPKGYSPVAPLCQYLAERAVLTDATVDEGTIMTWLGSFDAKDQEASSSLAVKLLSKQDFVSNAVTLESLRKNATFEDWTEETRIQDSKYIIRIWSKLSVITDNLPTDDVAHDTAYVRRLIAQFGTLGETLDLMHSTSCFAELPEDITVGMLQNDLFRKYINAGVITDLNEAVKNDENMSYTSFLNSLRGLISLVIDKLDDLGGAIK